MNKVKWGIIGVGDVTEVKSGPAFNKVENSEIEIVMRRNLEKAEDYALRHEILNYTNDVTEVLENKNVNAIYISTPPSSHAEYTIKAACAKKHVYVEKPMALNYQQCEDMVRACEKNNVKLFVAYYRRELPYFKKIKELIDNKVIGDAKFVDIKLISPPKMDDFSNDILPWRVIPDIAGAGYFYDLASHQFDFLDYIFGPIVSANGHSTNQLGLYDAEDIVSASFLFESNIIGKGIWCFSQENGSDEDSVEIIGSEGSISFTFFGNAPIRVIGKRKTQDFKIDHPRHIQEPLINTVVSELLDKGTCVSTGKSAMRTNKVLEDVLS